MRLTIPSSPGAREWLIGAGLAVVVFASVVVLVMVNLFGVEQLIGEPKWVTISELHASWDHGTNSMHISMKGNLQQSCRRIVVSKTARQIDDGVATNVASSELYGSLSRKMQTIAPGPFTVFDQARPKSGYLMPAHYLVTVTLFCEMNGEDKTTSVSDPASAIMVVPAIPVRPVQKPPSW